MSEYRDRPGDGENTYVKRVRPQESGAQPRAVRPAGNAQPQSRPQRTADPSVRPVRTEARQSASRPVRQADEYAPSRSVRQADGTAAPRAARPAAANRGTGTARVSSSAQSRPQSASRPRQTQSAGRASGSYAARLGKDRDKNRRAEAARFTEKKRKKSTGNPLAALPEWSRLALLSVVLVGLIIGCVQVIRHVGSQPERTTIRPISSVTETPEESMAPEATAELIAETNTESAATGVPAQPDATASVPEATEIAAQITAAPTEQAQQPQSGDAPLSGVLRKATIRMAGDIVMDTEMLDATYNKGMDSYSFAPYFEYIGDTLSSPDYTMINIDGSLRKGKYGYSGYPQFTTPPVILSVVKNVGVDMITMCNNHMLDAYCDGLVESVGRVDAAGLDHIGGYLDEADSSEPEIYEINGIRVGFVSYTHSTNTMENYCDDRTKFLVNYFKTADFEGDVRKVREAGAEFVVAVAHWGEEYKTEPDKDQVYWAQKLVAAGVDLIIGGHPHVVQPAEYITATDSNGMSRTALCVYSIGNFLTQHRARHTDTGIVFEFTLQDDGERVTMTNPGYVPVYVWTFKNAAGNDDYRVMPIGASVANPPADMSADQYQHMKECWTETLSLMGESTIIAALDK